MVNKHNEAATKEGAAEPKAYLLTRPSGFAWPLMPKDLTPETRAVFEADGARIDPLFLSAPPAVMPAAPSDAVDTEEVAWLLRKYKKLCVQIGRGDSYHLGRIERAAAALAQPAPVAAQPVFFASAEQANALQDRPDDDEGGVYLPLRKTAAGKFTMPLYAAPGAAIAAREQEAPTPQQISDYLNGLDAIRREVVEREALASREQEDKS